MCLPRLFPAAFPRALFQVFGAVHRRRAGRVSARTCCQLLPRAPNTRLGGCLLAVWLGCGLLVEAAPPVAVPDLYESLRNVVLHVGAYGAPEVLANDSDGDGDQLIAVKVTDPAHGTVDLYDDGRFDYTPTADYVGTDTFTYKANDAVTDSNVVTVTIKVRARDWSALGAGVGSSVSALACGASGDLYAGGDFTTAGGVAANHTAKWDGDNWHPLGDGVNGTVGCLAFDASGALYVGGSFTTAGGVAANRVAKWDGSSWHPLGAGVNGVVRTLALDASGALYVGGSFTSAGGVAANCVAKWDGAAWAALGAGMDGEVQALAVGAAGDLYAGGGFTAAGGVATNFIAKWDGSVWSGLGTGMVGGGVSGLVFDASGILYACGGFHTAGGADALHIATWSGIAWSALCPPASELPGQNFYALASDACGNVYAGGSFPDGLIRNVARWDGTRWLLLGSGLGDSVQALAVDAACDLYAGGQFTTAGGNPASYVAEYDIPRPPVAVADTYDTNRDMALDTVVPGVLANDTDADGESLTAVKVTDPTHGTLALNSAGSFTYTPDAGYAGPDSFTYKANDGVDDSDVATVTVTVWDGSWDALGAEVNGTVYVLAHDALGNLYAGGEFTSVRRAAANHIAKWDGTTWSALGEGMDSPVYSLAFDGTGALYAAGNFTLAGGVSVGHVAKWDGTSWSALGTGMDDYVNALAHDGMGNLYAGGNFTTAGGVAASRIAKWDGTAWSPLGSGMNNWVWALTFDAAGDLHAGGSFTTAGGVEARCVARWDGAAWSSLGTGLEARAWALAFDAAGNLYAGAEFSTPDAAGADRVAKWDGNAWSYLGTDMSGEVYALALGASGDLYAGGNFTSAGGVAASHIARWDGTAWSALGTGMNGCVWALESDALGDLYAGGDFTVAAGLAVSRVARYDIPSPPEAAVDTCETFRNTELVVTAPGLLANDSDLDGDALVAVKVTDPSHGTLLAFNADGSFTYAPTSDYVGPDSFTYQANDGVHDSAVVTVSIMVWDHVTWSAVGEGTSNSVRALSFDASGGLYVAGDFITAGGVEVNRIAAWDGTSWSALGTGMSGGSGVRSLARGASGDLYAAGYFTTAGGVAASRVAKWDGASWSALGSGLDSNAQALTLDGLGNLYAGGAFTMAGGQGASYVAKWDGGSWSALGLGMNYYVYALACDASGSLYAGGYFTTAGGQPAAYIAKWDGTSWSTLGTGMNDYVTALAFDASGNLYAGGSFTSAGGVAANHVAKWDGVTWSPLGSGVNWRVGTLALDASGDLYVGGVFSAAGTVAVNRIAKWDGMGWSPLGSGMNDQVGVLAFSTSGTLYAGGDFTIAGGTAATHLAKYEVASLPVATADAYETFRNTALTVPAPGVLGNDSDLNGDPLTAVGIDGPGHGTLVLNDDGSFTYTPDAGYVGEDTFTYKANDGVYDCGPVTVTITVRNRAPVAGNDAYNANRDIPLTIPPAAGVLANDADADGDVLTAVKVSDPAHGTLALSADGSFTYTPNAGHVGTDSFTYKANDGVDDSAIVTVAITVWDGSWEALGAGLDGTVYALAHDALGNLYAGGEFTTAGGVAVNYIAKWDGTTWSALGGGMDGHVYTLACDGTGALYAGGVFVAAGGVVVNGVAKWDGTTWSALGTGMAGYVNSLVPDGMGGLYAGGEFATAGGVVVNHVAKWDGTAWSSLGSGVDAWVWTLTLDASGTLYVGGGFSTAGGVAAKCVARWDGAAWSSLGPGLNSVPFSLGFDASGDLYAGGDFTHAGGFPANRVAKWDGDTWSSPLGEGVNWPVYALAFGASGDLYVGGTFTHAGWVAADRIARWDGTAWSALGTGMNGHIWALMCDASGDLYAGGEFTIAGGGVANKIAKYDIPSPPVAVPDAYHTNRNTPLAIPAPGVLADDSDADGDVLTAVKVTDPAHGTLVLADDGSFTYTPDAGYVGEDSFTYQADDGLDDSNVATVTIQVGNGRWSALGSEVDGSVSALVFDAAGDLFAGGTFTTAGGVVANRMAKWDGTSWSALGTGMDSSVLTLAFSASGDLYAGGQFTSAGGVAAGGIAKWNGDVWSALGTGVAGAVNALAFDAVGNLYAGGTFTTAGGVAANCIAKWDGTSWSALGTGMTGGTGVGALAFDGSGNLYAGGYFTAAGGVAANHLAKWDGTSWSALDAEVGDLVNALAFDASGDLHAGLSGGIGGPSGVRKWDGVAWSALVDGRSGTRDGTITRGAWALALDASGDLHAGESVSSELNHVEKWDGSGWSKLGSGMDDGVRALAFDASGTLYAAGDFTLAGGVAANYIAKWEAFQPPVAVDDEYETPKDTPLVVPPPGILTNDSAPNGDALTVTILTDPAHGTITDFSASGSFTYMPSAGYVGGDSFTYMLSDGVCDSTVATVTITVLQTHRLSVIGGTGGGHFPAGAVVPVTAEEPPAGQVFAGWTAAPGEYAANLANPNAESTTFTMPANPVTLTSEYRIPDDKLKVVPVVLAAASPSDKSGTQPTGISGVALGDTFVVELWAKNTDGSAKWLAIGGADLAYDTALLGAETGGLYHGATYSTLPQGTVDDAAGLVDEFGGGVAVGFEDTDLGTTHWARIGGVTFVAAAAGDATISLSAATTLQWFRKDGGGMEAIPWADVSLESTDVQITDDPRTPDPSGDDLCNLTDYGYLLGCYGKASGDAGWLPYGPMCDYNCDDVVNLIDYGYFLGFYGKPPAQWEMPVIGRGGGRETKLEVVAVAVSAAGALDKATVLPTGLTSVALADTFSVELWVKNADASPSWVSVGGVDVGYTTSGVDVDSLHHGGVYVNLPQGVVDEASGLVDEFGGGVGAGTVDTELGTSHWARLGHVQVTATALGVVQFTPSAASTAQFFRNDPFAAIGWADVQFTGASLTVVAGTHDVTFSPGAHGAIPAANSGADYVVTVADGGAAPAAPAAVAAAGWQLAGWDWQPTRRSEAPTTITQDWTATAQYEEATPDWSVDLVLTGLAPATLTFGMRSDATDGWDPRVDVQYPLPVAGQACLASDDLALSYSTDLHAPARTGEFLLIASATIDAAASVAWDVSALPSGTYLTIYEVLLDGVAPSREPIARELVGCTALNMALVQSLDVPAGETRCYVIRYGDDLVFELGFLPGWNLVSLPIEPLFPALDLVLDDGQSRAAGGSELRDGLRGTIHSASVWTWAGQGYVAVTEMHACVGYWVYAPEAVVILVHGVPADQVAFDLKRGWNQCGVEVVCPMPNAPCIIGTPWGWRPLALRYEPVDTLCPGMGYWINASEDSLVPLPTR